MREKMTKWVLFNVMVAFAVYWLSNLVLWYPWSISPLFGMLLMLTLGTVMWALAVYQCLIRYPEKNLMKAAAITGIVLFITAIVMDYLFFGIIRNAMEELYHPTTFYGYAFVISLPFIEVFFLKSRLKRKHKEIIPKSIFVSLLTGMLFLLSIILIIKFDIRIN